MYLYHCAFCYYDVVRNNFPGLGVKFSITKKECTASPWIEFLCNLKQVSQLVPRNEFIFCIFGEAVQRFKLLTIPNNS